MPVALFAQALAGAAGLEPPVVDDPAQPGQVQDAANGRADSAVRGQPFADDEQIQAGIPSIM